ncbi:DNA-directed RNA polymerase I subunit 1 [Juglans microcarpa x Juglans regia]|uniref:DNA-directed RNA polymerase I subunit 1 n=1 Tax=Juglans microcarpa x Juglans regia TaxID=2249226 RepID=UPI001B7E597E|nr:DNA-directed RNA polymerase I subunit 1 [Juglans microcarpa x Juglans regia]XP_041024312.1 DNA-directed RNA polymerase I subunit 1 [Juglans microcarpa x Juglans regia]
MAQITEGTTEHVEAVRFSFFTDEEVREHSVVKVTNPILLDSMERPVPGGLYDPELGPLDERSLCKKCGQRSFHCPGHCGHIDLVSPAYNPLLFNILYNLLQRTCLFCHHFRASRSQVETCISQLKLIVKGDVVGAKRLDSDTPGETSYPNDGDWSQNHDAKYLRQQGWTSLQFMEAMSVFKKFLRPRFVVCKSCGAKNPKISKPTFGWFHMSGMSGADARRNAIRGCKLGRSSTGGTNGKSLPEVENTDDMTHWGDVVDIVETDPSSVASPGARDSATKKQRKKGGEVLLDFVKQKDLFSGPLLPSEVKEIVKLLWENESQLCSFISDIQHQGFKVKDSEPKTDYSMFFLETILVPPIKFRPPSKGGDSVMEHPQTVLLGKVLQSNISLGNAHVNNLERSKIVSRWMDLQQSINVLFDSKTATGQGQRNVASGICQLLEKKEGMFRQKMMGKRVNFACRSVISPDPYLAVNEIGIPPYFALRLTYPERVTPWNVVKLRNAIINGSDIHPGATQYGDKLDTKQLPPSRKGRIAISRKLPSSRGLLTQHGKSCDYEFEGKFVRRHLQDGDIVLVNRQPTLHKPSIMAHVVRVLKGEKTLRMHYANCSTYNADFDGDEMNVHFPQDEISRAEAYNIVNANNQYVKPTSGEPIRALIQDHVVSAVLLTKKDTFFTGDEFNQLLYCAGISTARPVSFLGKFGQKVCMLNSEDEMQPLLPAIWKPVPLWTGKQVISALLNHITKGHPPFTVEKDAKLPRDFFKSGSDEDELNKEEKAVKKGTKERVLDDKKLSKGKRVDGNASKKKEPDEDKLLIYRNDLVRGVIDKAQFGEYGLVHTVQELYGSNTAGILLSALSRLFTAFLQVHGFTCGVDDLLLMKKKDDDRDKNLLDCEKVGEEVHRMFVSDKGGDKIDLLQLKIEEKIRSNGEPALTDLDRKMISKLNEELSKNFFKELLSRGLLKPSGKNCISLMTTSGAKGASVNFQQISSHLGQQELEGKRVPRMVSGKTLPCFPPWDWAARAGGFIIDRFLTGLHPQEYYFHCMAGREGLVDTAVKTSRSGYLQRCLIKNLECLKICYDHTVRDADGSIIQFCYGEDGVDVHQTSYIAKFEALAANKEMIFKKCGQELQKSNSYIKELPCALEEKAKEFVRAFSLRQKNPNDLKEADFLKLMEHKYVLSLAQPGEPVGVLAAQSVGEPSTQMTLNTFHLAGRGEMNVTLGIPRLQEILMTASSDIKTPVMTCPFQIGRSKEDASCLADKLKKITVADIIKNMKVSVIPFVVHDHQTCSIYKLEMMLHIPENYPKHTDITLEDWEGTLEVVFVRELEDAIQNHLLLLSKISGIETFMPDSQSNASNGTEDDDVSGNKSHREEENDDDNDADDGGGSEDLGMDAQKRKQQATDEMDYGDSSEEEPDEGELSAGSESELDRAEDEIEVSNDAVIGIVNVKDVTCEPSELGKPSKHKLKDKRNQSEAKRKKRARGKLVKKEYDRAFFVKTKGMHFEVHFRFTNEPHILLAQIAQKTAKKVYIQSFGKIDGCKVVTCKEKQVIYYGKNPKDRKDISSAEKEKVPALQTTGVDFSTLWQFQDVLDVRYVYSNNIHAMLTTYGVEAARETIIREIQHVFGSYGISVNMRHLTLIAEYMTHSGGYRPMNRLGGIAESTSPFSKMSFETASKFIVEAAYHGERDELETPSARICLGLPVKMGTGCFDLMQKIEI